MRMNKGAILASMVVIALASVLAGAATTAFFSDTATKPVVFEAGTLDIKIWDEERTGWKENAVSVTFSDMAPGDIEQVYFYIANTGSLPIKALLLDMDVTHDSKLGKYLYVYRWVAGYGPNKDTITWGTWHGSNGYGGGLVRDYAKHLEGSCEDHSDDLLPFVGPSGITQIDTSGGNDVVAICYEFEFRETKGDQNDAQGKSMTISLKFMALSSPCSALV